MTCHPLQMRRSSFVLRPLVALVLSALVAASCGGSDEPDTATATSAPTQTTSVAAPTTTEASPATTATPATTSAPVTTAAPTTTAAPSDSFELIGAGPYAVGVTTITVGADTDRPLTVDLWFPLADDASGDPQQYTLLPGVYYESPDAVGADASAVSADGPFPLVVYSHGSGGLRYIHSNYTETLASHGYVVAAPDHTGNTSLELIANNPDPFEVIAANRPTDIRNLIDALEDPASAAGAFTASIDADRIAVTGHSFGGFTAYATVIGHDNPAGAIEPDERVDAIITLAPATGEQLLSDERLAAIDVPNMVIVGTDDKTTPVDPNVTRPWELSTFSPAYRVELLAAEHQTFTDVCDYQEFLPQLEGVPEFISAVIDDFAQDGCQPGDMQIDRAQALTNTFALRFLAEVFAAGDPLGSAEVAALEDVAFETK